MAKTTGRVPVPLRVRLQRFIKTPKAYALGALIVLTLVGSRTTYGHHAISHALIAVGTAIGFDGLVALVMKRPLTVSTGGVITALIVVDVLSSMTPIVLVVVATVLALASKHLVKQGRKPLFNPAAVGLLIVALVFSQAESWWAAMPNDPLGLVGLLLAVGVFVAVRVKKYAQVLAFLGTYFAFVGVLALAHGGLASATPADALRPPFVNAALFLGFFMLTDPPTSPGVVGEQIAFAVVSALVAVSVYAVMGGLVYLFVGLLAGNGLAALLTYRRRQSRSAGRGMRPQAVDG